jgi:hypothetical protein
MAVRRPTKAELVKIQRLLAGEEIGFSSLSGPVFRELIDKEYIVLDRTGKRKMIAVVKNAEYLMKVLRQNWQINDIQEYIAFLDKEERTGRMSRKCLAERRKRRQAPSRGSLSTPLKLFPTP